MKKKSSGEYPKENQAKIHASEQADKEAIHPQVVARKSISEQGYSCLNENGEKEQLCLSVLENSLTIPQAYRELIMEVLMRIPSSDLEKIWQILDRFIFINEGTSGSTEQFLWRCMAKHRMKTLRPIMDGEKPCRMPTLIEFDTFAIILIENELNKMTKENKMFVIAHELAHVFLHHRVYGRKAKEDLRIEEKANKQVKKWGFKVF
jgi:hypothetical protein